MSKIKIKNLDLEEYESYLNLLKQLTNYEYSISKQEFSERYKIK
jgi:hypothetical protein